MKQPFIDLLIDYRIEVTSNGVINYKELESSNCLLAINNIRNGQLQIAYWLILKNIDNQTPELCMKVVKQNGYALKYVKDQTFEICLEAVKETKHSLDYIKDENMKKQIKEILYSF